MALMKILVQQPEASTMEVPGDRMGDDGVCQNGERDGGGGDHKAVGQRTEIVGEPDHVEVVVKVRRPRDHPRWRRPG